MKIQCPECASSFEVPHDKVGKHGKCGKCSHVFVLAEAGSPLQDKRDRRGGVGGIFLGFLLLAICAAAAWAGWNYFPLLGDRGNAMEIPPGTFAVGRLHPLIIHLPIGLLLGAALIDIIGGRRAGRPYRRAVGLLMGLGALGSVAACVAGYIWATEEGAAGAMIERHMFAGLAMAAAAVLAVLFKAVHSRTSGGFASFLYRIFLWTACLLMFVAGHIGGSSVHGEDFLTEHLPAPIKKIAEPMFAAVEGRSLGLADGEGADDSHDASEAAPDPDIFADVIAPIFAAKCVACHGPDKEKGKLRMDSFEKLMAGGSEGDSLVPGDLEASLIAFRIDLPRDDDEAMPPEDKDQLTADEVALIKWWIESGAASEGKVAEAGLPDELSAAALAVSTSAAAAAAVASTGDSAAAANADAAAAPVEPVEPVAPTFSEEDQGKAIAAVEGAGASLRPLFAESEELQLNALNVIDTFGDEQLALLAPVAERISEVDLARSQVTDAGLEAIGAMSNLRTLKLQGTGVTDAGIAHLAGLEKLESVNVYGTKITDEGLRSLAQLPSLKKVYAWETAVTPRAAEAIEWFRPELAVNLGWDEPAKPESEDVAPVEEAVNPEVPAPAPEPKPEVKPEEPKPAAEEATESEPEPAKPAEPAPGADKKPEPNGGRNNDPRPQNPPADEAPEAAEDAEPENQRPPRRRRDNAENAEATDGDAAPRRNGGKPKRPQVEERPAVPVDEEQKSE